MGSPRIANAIHRHITPLFGPSEAAAACECLTLRQRRCGFHRQFIAGRMVCLECVNTEWIVAALGAEIARLRLARTLVAQSTTAAAFGYSGVSISNDLKPKKRKKASEACITSPV
jgi:hypothetical protein